MDLDERPSGLVLWLMLVIVAVLSFVAYGVFNYLVGP